MELQAIVKTVNGRIEPIRAAVEDLQKKQAALKETEESVSQLQEGLELAVLAVDECEVAAAMQPSAAAAKALNQARGRHTDALEALDFARARIRGFRRAIDAELAGLAQRSSELAEIQGELKLAIIAAYAPKFEAAWAAFQQVLGEGLLLANAARADGLGIPLRRNEVYHPASNDKLFGSHDLYVTAACDATPNQKAIEGTLFPVVAEMEQIRAVIEDAAEQTRSNGARDSGQAVMRGVSVTIESAKDFQERQEREAAERDAQNRVREVKPLSLVESVEFTIGGNVA